MARQVAVDRIDGVSLAYSVEIDEIFTGSNPHRPHRFSQQAGIEAWLSRDELEGFFQHRERKIRTDGVRFWTTEEMPNYHGDIVGYRHRYRFSDANTAFHFRLQFGGALITLG